MASSPLGVNSVFIYVFIYQSSCLYACLSTLSSMPILYGISLSC
jgi:hypothetical protein